MVDVFEWLGHGYAFYRAFQDAGMWIIEHDIRLVMANLFNN